MILNHWNCDKQSWRGSQVSFAMREEYDKEEKKNILQQREESWVHQLSFFRAFGDTFTTGSNNCFKIWIDATHNKKETNFLLLEI